jgi:hypothetical protein
LKVPPDGYEHGNEVWHRQALALRREAEDTASQRLADLLTAEANEVVRRRAATKIVSEIG